MRASTVLQVSRYPQLAAVGLSVTAHLLLLLWPLGEAPVASNPDLPRVLFIRVDSGAVPQMTNLLQNLPEKKQMPPGIAGATAETQASGLGGGDLDSENTPDVGHAAVDISAVHFYEKSELNRFPVLTKPLELNTDGLSADELQAGHADVWLYISASGEVVEVHTEFSSLSPVALVNITEQLKQAHFKPGYLSGDPVPSKIRWRVTVEFNAGLIWLSR